MDAKTAREILYTYAEKKPSEIAEAVDVLYQEFGTYEAIAQQVGRSDKFWNARHRIFQLPAGIQWKIDQDQISIGHAYHIFRLEAEGDQWLLAIAIIEAENLTADECKAVVDLVLKKDEPMLIKDALSIRAGIHFDKTHPLLLPLPFDIWLAVCKRAWTGHQNWEDLTYQLILQGLDIDPEEVASQFEKAANQLLKNAKDLRKASGNKSENGIEPTQKSK